MNNHFPDMDPVDAGWRVIRAGIIIIALFLVSMFFLSCNSQKKTQRYLFEHPEFAAAYCAEQFPVKDSVSVRDSISFDTLYMESFFTDTVISNITDTAFIERPEKIKTIIKTVRKDSVIYRRDAAEEKRLKNELSACYTSNNIVLNKYSESEKDISLWKAKAKRRWWIIFVLIGIGIGVTGFKIFRSPVAGSTWKKLFTNNKT